MSTVIIGFIQPTQPEIIEALAQINQGDADAALASLARAQGTAEIEDTLWKNYVEALILFKQDKFDDGYNALLSLYERVRDSKADFSIDVFRILGAALKKMGWYWRRKKEFEKAYAFHAIQFNYLNEYGSPVELHDTCISLDVDSFSLKDLRQSEFWLRRGLEAAQQIEDGRSRARAMGMSCNNLAGTLYSLNRFDEAVNTINLSMKHWEEYEVHAGTQEFRVLWAHYGVGDVYENWARFLKENGRDFSQQKQRSIESYQQSLELAQQRELPEKESKVIAERLATARLL